MFRVILLSCAVSSVLAGHFYKFIDPCMIFTNTHGLKCAKQNYTLTNAYGMGQHTDDLKECYPPKGKFMHFPTCVAHKKGYLAADGTVDRKALSDIMTRDFANDPQLAENINKYCVNGDLSKFFEKKYYRKMNELRRIEFCVELHIIRNIKEWNDEGACHGMKTMMEDCTRGINETQWSSEDTD